MTGMKAPAPEVFTILRDTYNRATSAVFGAQERLPTRIIVTGESLNELTGTADYDPGDVYEVTAESVRRLC